jgi:hypothetical protein
MLIPSATAALQVEAWGDKAQKLAQQVQPGVVLFLQGHLALDLRYNERSPSHGPALTVEADTWDLVTPGTIPEGRAACTYKGGWHGFTWLQHSVCYAR